MQVLSIMSMKTNDDLKICNVNIKSFTENIIRFKTTRQHLNAQKKRYHKPELGKALDSNEKLD